MSHYQAYDNFLLFYSNYFLTLMYVVLNNMYYIRFINK